MRRLILTSLLAACADPGPTAVPDAAPELPVAACGQEGWRYDPDGGQGQVVDWEPRDDFDLQATALDALMSLAGFDALSPVPFGTRMVRFRYTTVDRGAPTEATSLLAMPQGTAPSGQPWPVVLLLHGFAGVADPCAPSGDDLLGPALAAVLASRGFVVIAPDYIGLSGFGAASTAPHAPLVGEQIALGSWHAWQAGRALLEGDLADRFPDPVRDDVVIWGGSQGGHGALFVDLYAPYVAPEASVAAVVATSPAHDLGAVVEGAMAAYGDSTGLTAMSLGAMRRWYGTPDALTSLVRNEHPLYLADGLEEALANTASCTTEVGEGIDDIDEVEDIYVPEAIEAVRTGDWDALEPWSCFLDANSLTQTAVPRIRTSPTLVVYGEEDTLVEPALQREDHGRLCDAGWDLTSLQCAEADHAGTTLWSLPEQEAFVRARLAGEATADACGFPEPTRCEGQPDEE